ncbi:hypothetical protein [Dictyobacter aurantiacus]|uniref:Baseplate protein J-like domain-containing protein n=1 Tax=Dictyobacter aurantiacus TaxID=1936993 RepID=A0A401ZL25_9CHLR|nr:hypothetical protein [Dictyobacter aurantiacus]GCE07514.1 hypothetical protein KDAU_48430 [Dictyobacter aurantiacus]
MRQGNGTDLLGMNDPRSATIGVIYVAPTDDRKSVLGAILTQDKLNRQQIVIVLPNPNKAFQRPQDFDDLKSVRRRIQREMIFVSPSGPGPAEFARQRNFPVYDSLEAYTQALREGNVPESPEAVPAPAPEKKNRFFGGRGKAATTGAIAGAAAGAAASRLAPRDPQSTMKFNEAGADPQTGAPVANTPSPQVPSTPRMPETPHRGTLDDDDDLGPATGPGAAAMGAGAGLAADRMRRSARLSPPPHDLDDDELETGAPADKPARNSKSLRPDPNATQQAGAAAAGASPGIIDLQPVNQRTPGGVNRTPTRTPGRSNEPPVVVPTELDDADVPPPPTHGAGRRRSGAMGAAAVGAAGLAGAAAASQHPQSAAAAGSTSAIPAQRPPAGGPPPAQRPGQQRPRRRGSRLLLLIALLLLLLLLFGISYGYIDPNGFQSMVVRPVSSLLPKGVQGTTATVTITPDSRVVTDNYVMQAVTNNPNAQQLQIKLRNLTATPDPQMRQVTGTGHTQTPAAKAHGTLTFKNGSTQPFTVGAGTVIPTRAGVSIITDQVAPIPAAQPSSGLFGSVTIKAHAVTGGTIGNLGAGTLNGNCCNANNFIFVSNNTFTGGQDPQDYTFVQQGDVDAVVNPLVTSLSKQAQSDFNKQLAANEQLVGDPVCSKSVATNKGEIGDQGHNITSTTVTVSATCTGMAYDQKGAQQVAQSRLQTKAASDPGSGYALVGNITSHVDQVTRRQGNIFLLVSAQGTWVYQIGDAQKSQLAHNLAGKKLADAQAFLNGQKGFKSTTIKLSNDSKTMPTDPNQITIDVVAIPGSKGTPGGTPPVSGPDATPTPSAARGLISSASLKG